MPNVIWSHLNYRDLVELGALVICLVIFWFVPRFANPVFAGIETIGTRLARNRGAALLVVPFAVIALRVCILPVIPVPFPQVHDEFSYLLAGDTFAHGRLTNPPHPMRMFFDTIHVDQQPTYMSKYPPAQGAVLALGEILGNPWIGVLLSCALMCAAVLWALQGWLPRRWALLGAAIFSLRVGLFSYWMNSYWGGAAAATGGALVVGAFPRILRRWRMRDAALMGMGMLILSNSRPFEGLIFCGPIAVGLIVALWKNQKGLARKTVLLRFVIPLIVAGAVGGGFLAYYNFRGTGHPFLFPYTINDRTYLTTPIFGWGTPRTPFHHSSAQLDDFYNGWARSSWLQGRADSFQKIARTAALDAVRLSYFFLWPELCFVATALLLLIRAEKFRFLILQLVFCVGGFVSIPWFQPHYAAPLSGALFCTMTQGIRYIRQFRHQDKPIGIGLSRIIVLFVALLAPLHHQFPPSVPPGMEYRHRFSVQLGAVPGNHLVIVRYSSEHDSLAEWVYNDADIDHSKIVWARDIPGADLAGLLNYFSARRVWLVEPDLPPPRLASWPK